MYIHVCVDRKHHSFRIEYSLFLVRNSWGEGGSYSPEEKFTHFHCQNLAGLFVSAVNVQSLANKTLSGVYIHLIQYTVQEFQISGPNSKEK